MESSDPSAEAEYANSIAQGVYDESVALMDKITNQAKENADNEEADAHKIKYENEEAFNPVEAMKMLCTQINKHYFALTLKYIFMWCLISLRKCEIVVECNVLIASWYENNLKFLLYFKLSVLYWILYVIIIFDLMLRFHSQIALKTDPLSMAEIEDKLMYEFVLIFISSFL